MKILTRHDESGASAARAFRDHDLLFDFEVLIDVFAVNAQLPGSAAIRAPLLAELAGIEHAGLVAGSGHELPLRWSGSATLPPGKPCGKATSPGRGHAFKDRPSAQRRSRQSRACPAAD